MKAVSGTARLRLAAVAVLLCACGGSTYVAGNPVAVRDSAGIQIAEIGGDPWNAPRWAAIDSANPFRILPNPAEPATLFNRIRGALRLENGDIAVLDAGNFQIRFFDRMARPIRSFGRRGEGPSEFEMPWRLLRGRADSLVVVDLHGFIQIFAASSDSARRVKLPWGSGTGSAHVLEAFADGHYLVIMNDLMQQPQPGRNLLHSSLYVMAASGDAGITLGRQVIADMAFKDAGNGRVESVELLFWAEPGWTGLADSYVWCLTERFECDVWSEKGHRVRSIRAAVSGKPVPAADYVELEKLRLSTARTQNDSARVRNGIAEGIRAERYPIHSLIRSDSHDRIWMREFSWKGDERTARWLVFDPTGGVLGIILLPTDLTVFDIGDDYILGSDRDENDVPGIVMYRYAVDPPR